MERGWKCSAPAPSSNVCSRSERPGFAATLHLHNLHNEDNEDNGDQDYVHRSEIKRVVDVFLNGWKKYIFENKMKSTNLRLGVDVFSMVVCWNKYISETSPSWWRWNRSIWDWEWVFLLKQIYLWNELQLMKTKSINLRLGEWMLLLKQISLERAPAVVEAADSCSPPSPKQPPFQMLILWTWHIFGIIEMDKELIGEQILGWKVKQIFQNMKLI